MTNFQQQAIDKEDIIYMVQEIEFNIKIFW